MMQDLEPRSPKDYTEEMHADAVRKLDDENRVLVDFIAACVLLEISRPHAYGLARKDELPGCIRLGNTWKVRRAVLKKFLYGEE